MFVEMRRRTQALPESVYINILDKATSGVLAVCGDEGYPYTVPLSYVYADGKIYFHCATAGHKLDAIRRCDKVSFCVVEQDAVVPEQFTTYYRSVVLFGRARIIENAAEKRAALIKLAEKYSPGQCNRDKEISGSFDRLCMVEITPEHITGKEAIELAKKRK